MFLCKDCGNEFIKWSGKCPQCDAWGTLKELGDEFNPKTNQTTKSPTTLTSRNSKSIKAASITSALEVKEKSQPKHLLHDRELKHLFSGGLYAGSSYLISGEPGIGKSTLLLLLAYQLKKKILYISGEETLHQVKRRITRTNTEVKDLYLTQETNMLALEKKLAREKFDIVMVDSLQTIYHPHISGAAGSITQMKHAAQELISFCRTHQIAIIITGHINKSGDIAGPKLIEHLVDASYFFYLTKSIGNFVDIRVLSTLKNRFGSVEVSALFYMQENGLQPLTQEVLGKAYFPETDNQDERNEPETGVCGACLFPHFLGKRLLFYEIESLVVDSKLSIPRRSVEGISISRLNRILAILEKYCQLDFNSYDVFIQVTGGFKGNDLLIDLSLIACIYSSLKNFVLPKKTLFLGEVGLSGKIKTVPNLSLRTKEIDQYGSFLYFSSHREKNSVIAVKGVVDFLEKLEKSQKLI